MRDSKPSGLLTNVYHADLFLLLCSQLKGGWEHWPGPPAKKYLPDRGRQRGATYPLPRVPPKLVKRKAARSRRIEAQAVLLQARVAPANALWMWRGWVSRRRRTACRWRPHALWRFGGPLLVLIAASSVHNVKEKSVASSAFCLRLVPELGCVRLLGAGARALEVGPFEGA